MEENVKEEKFSVGFEYYDSIFTNKFVKNSLTIFSQKNKNEKKLLICLENLGEKAIEIKIKTKEIFLLIFKVITNLHDKLFAFSSQLKNNCVEKHLLNFFSHKEYLLSKSNLQIPLRQHLQIFVELVQELKFFRVILKKKLFLICLRDNALFVFNHRLEFIEAKHGISQINYFGEKTLTINFKSNVIKLRFFSKSETKDFFDKSKKNANMKENFHKRIILYFLRNDDPHLMRNLFLLNKEHIRHKNPNLFYLKNVYNVSEMRNLSNINSCRNTLNLLSEFIFLFNEKTLMTLTKHRKFLEIEQIKETKIENELEYSLQKNSFNENGFNIDKENCIFIENKQNKKRSSIRNQQNNNIRIDRSYTFVLTKGSQNTMVDEISLRNDSFNKLTFDVAYKGEKRCIEITADGIMKLFKPAKMDNFITFTVEDILTLEGDAQAPTVTLTTQQKKNYLLTFQNSYEKYIFKTVVYNQLVLNMKEREKIKNKLKLNVNVMTWNVAVIDVPNDLIKMFVQSKILENSDIFTFGVQECGIFKMKAWQKTVKTLAQSYNFTEVRTVEMCQMFLSVFIKNDLVPFLENVESSYKPMGFAKIIGNKGGLIISFKLMGFHFVFVNCHLAPKPHKVLERNNHAKNLLKSLRVGEKFCEFEPMADYLFWQGDLNYRVDYIYDEVLTELKRHNIRLLLTKDQLIKQRQTNQVFYNFQEAEICFFPTYRRIKGTEQYSNKNNQAPSWCDRILVKTSRALELLFYDSIKELKMSDHLPVVGKYSIFLTIPTFDNVEKDLNDNKNMNNYVGRFIFDKIVLDFNFTEAFAELELQPKFPFKLKLSLYYFMNSKCAESKLMEIKDEENLQKIAFEDIRLNYPSQLFFNFPHSRAINIFFVLTAVVNKTNYEIGFAKYSLEDIESNGLNLIAHNVKLDITLRTRKFGTLIVNAKYKF